MECNVLLHIIDKNDNAPKFSSSSYEVRVHEDASVGEAILQLKVLDLDTGQFFKQNEKRIVIRLTLKPALVEIYLAANPLFSRIASEL